MNIKNKEYLFKDFDYDFKVTKELKESIKNNPSNFLNCSYRIKAGMFFTDEELDTYIKESLNRPLPDNSLKLERKLKRKNIL